MIRNDVNTVTKIEDGDLRSICCADRKKEVVKVDGREKVVEVLMKRKGSMEKGMINHQMCVNVWL